MTLSGRQKGDIFMSDLNEKTRVYFKYGLLFVLISIAMFAAFNNLGSVLAFLDWVVHISMPVIIGCLLALVLNAPLRGFHRLLSFISSKTEKKWGRKLPVAFIDTASLVLTLICTALIIYHVFDVVVPRVVNSVSGIGDAFMLYYPKLIAELKGYGVDTAKIEQMINYLNVSTLIGQMTQNMTTVVDTAYSAASSVVNTALNIFTGTIIAIYILAGKKKLKRQCKKLTYAYIEEKKADRICEIARLCSDTFFHFISGQCLDAFILGMMFFFVMSIFNMPYTVITSMFIGVMALIPYLGPLIGMLAGFLLIVMISPMKALGFLLIFLVLQQIDSHLIYPKIVGNSMGLPAIWTLLAALLGNAFMGLPGMLVFIPLTSVLYTLIRENVNNRLMQKKIKI